MRRLTRAPRVLWRYTFEGLLLLADGSDVYVSRTPGDVIWGILDEPLTEDALLRELESAFPDVEPEHLRQDTRAFVQSLLALGALEEL